MMGWTGMPDQVGGAADGLDMLIREAIGSILFDLEEDMVAVTARHVRNVMSEADWIRTLEEKRIWAAPNFEHVPFNHQFGKVHHIDVDGIVSETT